MAIREGYVDVVGNQTRVLTIGGWIEDKLPSDQVILCIPGNPGLTGYYRTFLSTLYATCGVPVWVVSHAGHELPPGCREPLKDNLSSYDVCGQTRHKLAFIERYIPRDVRITLIGHSIGCKIILDALSVIPHTVDRSYLLFPTVEHIADTPNGRFLTGRVKPFVFLIVFAAWLFQLLPFSVRQLLISIWFILNGTPTDMADVTVGLVRPGILRNVFYMAFDEMDRVLEPNTEALERYGEQLVFYYGASDGWTPPEYCQRMRRSFPRADVRMCENGYEHTFVLGSSVSVGLMVGEWIQAAQ